MCACDSTTAATWLMSTPRCLVRTRCLDPVTVRAAPTNSISIGEEATTLGCREGARSPHEADGARRGPVLHGVRRAVRARGAGAQGGLRRSDGGAARDAPGVEPSHGVHGR